MLSPAIDLSDEDLLARVRAALNPPASSKKD